jgi:type II secretory pathway component PulF
VRLPLARLETLFLTIAQSLEAGLTFAAFANGPGAADLPRSISDRFKKGVRRGEPLSEIFDDLGILEPLELALLRAGERRGDEAGALRSLVRRCEARRADRRRVLSRLAYPGLLLVAAILIQPVPSLFSNGIGTYLGAILPRLAAIGGALFFAKVLLSHGGLAGAPLRTLFQILPPFSHIARLRARSSFADVLGESVRAGLSIKEAIALAASSAAHDGFRRVDRVIARVDQGASLSVALGELSGLDRGDLALIANGERAGKLEELLAHMARDYDQRARTAVIVSITTFTGLVTAAVMAWMAVQIIGGWRALMRSS